MGAHPQSNDWVVVPELPDLFQWMERKILTMEKLRAKLKENSGFTLVEMLIVVAIIAILIMVSIPVVTGALEKARDATDQANERAAKAEATMIFMGIVDHPDSTKNYVAGEETGEMFYNAHTGKMESSDSIEPYGQCTKKGECYTGTAGTTEHPKSIIKVSVDEDANVTIEWATPTT